MRVNSIAKALSLVLILALAACEPKDPNQEIDEGKIKGQIYKSEEIGWTIVIPKDWTVVSKDKMESTDQKGRDAIEKSSGIKITAEGLKHLISFQKDRFNMFSATSEPYKEEFPGEYEQNNRTLIGVIYDTFVDQGIKLDSSSGKEIIKGLEFYAFHTTIYKPDGSKALQQVLYSRLINGYDFAININYTNEEDRKTMMDALKGSKFTNPH